MIAAQREMPQLRKTIVVVEDDPFNAEILDLLLRQVGSYETLCFENGRDALDHCNDIVACRPLAFIFDYCLPYINGLDLSLQLHKIQGLESIPTIILTALRMDENKQELAGDPFMTVVFKPYDIQYLFDTIHQIIANTSIHSL